MSTSAKTGSRYVPSADLLPPPPFGRALLFAGLTALVGATVWGLLAFYAHREFGILAWATGLALGFVTVKAGGYGTPLALSAGALALLSIGSGKHIAFRLGVDQEAHAMAERLNEAVHAEHTQDAADWVALGASPTTAQIREFASSHGFEPENPETFARVTGANLTRFANEKPTLEAWRTQVRETLVEEMSFVDYLREDFQLIDLLFLGLGVTSAFGLVSKATTQLRVATRQAARAEHEASETPAS